MAVCNVPIYIDITVEDQIGDLMAFLKQLIKKQSGETAEEPQAGAGKSKNASAAAAVASATAAAASSSGTITVSTNENVTEIVNIFEIVFSELPESELEIILNNIVSVLVIVDVEKNDDLMKSFCSKLLKAAAAASENKTILRPILLRVLWLLFQALDKSNTIRCAVYEKVLETGMLADRFQSVYKSFAKFQKLFADINENCIEMRSLYRKLYEILMERNQSEEALKVIMKLLATYTDDGNASDAKSDAMKCVLLAIADKNTFLFEPLLDLKPVQKLEGDPIYNLLRIFVSESYQIYADFYKKHVDLIRKQWKLDHEQNLRKMRQLTFMQLVEDCTEITFQHMSKELNISEDDVEQFIIEIIKTKLVKARIDQTARKVKITSSMSRTFGMKQWQNLSDILHVWRQNLDLINESLTPLAAAGIDPLSASSGLRPINSHGAGESGVAESARC